MKIHPYKGKESNQNPVPKRRIFDILTGDNRKPCGYTFAGYFVMQVFPCYYDKNKAFLRLEGFKFLMLIDIYEEMEIVND